MRKSGVLCFLGFGLSALPLAPARAQAPEIAHDAVSCIVVGKYPKLKACFTPAAQVAKARVYFRREDRPVWYHVEMAAEEACFVGILPRPNEELVGMKVPYYVEVANQKLDVGRTEEHGPAVVKNEVDCKAAVAPYLTQASVKVYPKMPPGFSKGGVNGSLIAGGAAAIGLGLGILASGGNEAAVTPTPQPSPGAPTTPPPSSPSPRPSPSPTGNGPPSGVFNVNPDPPVGTTPMTVRFNLCRSTDPDNDPLVFRYDFGDGQRARGTCREEHVYEAPANSASVLSRRLARADTVFHAQVCVGDGRPDHDQCQTFDVRVATEPQPPGSFPLTVTLAGAGTGSVTSDSGGIACPGTCTASYVSGTPVTLTAQAAAGSAFGGWSVAACGTAPTCTIAMTSPQTVTATFTTVTFPLTVNLAGTGPGRVSSSITGIDCPGTCTANFPAGQVVVLTATPTPGVSTFAGWSIASCGIAPSCTVTMTGPINVTATFNAAGVPLTVSLAGTGAGRVTSDIGGIDCPRTACTATYTGGPTVTLTAEAAAGSVFSGWGGACAAKIVGGPFTCTVAMTSARSVTATFDLPALRRITVLRTGNGLVDSDVQPGIVCGAACSYPSFSDGAIVVLRAAPDPGWTFNGWGGDACAGVTGPCTLVMTQDFTITATFGSAGRPADRAASALSWISDLRVARGRGQVVVNQRAWEVDSGQQRITTEAPPGEVRFEATLTQAAGVGLWRFELTDGLVEPGTLRAVEGKVEALMANAVVFRLTGKAGERVAFVYRLAKR